MKATVQTMSRIVKILVITALTSGSNVKAMLIEEQIPSKAVKVTASSTFSPSQDARHLVDGSGLSSDRHDNDAGAKTMWHSVEKPVPSTPATGLPSVPAWVRFDFPQPTAFDEIRIWNHNQANYTDRGFRKARLSTSADGAAWSSRAVEIPQAKGAKGEPVSLVMKTDGKPVKSIIIAAESNYGSAYCGLSEVRFIARREVAEKDLPFPTGMECKAQAYYGHRPDGQPGRAITLDLAGARLFGNASVEVGGETTRFENLTGASQLTILLPAGLGVTNECAPRITFRQGQRALEQSVTVPPKRQWTVFVYPHSHQDIGYTEPQDVVEKVHINNMNVGLELGQATAGYPEGARHVWNNEVLWAVESWVKQATPAKKQAFVEAVKKGWIGLSASYANLNTSVASDEELLRFFSYARRLRELTGVPIDTMCQFDIPGLSWGIVQAAAQNGIRAILDFPNPSDRIGNIHTWRNRHFRWVGPDGKSKVLYLQIFPYNVAWKLGAQNMNPRPFVHVPGRDRFDFANSPLMGTGDLQPGPKLEDFLRVETDNLERAGSPYDLYPIAWSLSDNSMVDSGLPDYVKKWNEKYAFPKLVIASATTIADAFEQRFGSIIPEHRGDLTEYWTDGLGSDARRVGYNRVAKENLVQAETLWTMLRRNDPFPQAEFYEAWRWIQLGSEHTWGYMDPAHPIAKKIEATKASYFENARKTAAELLAKSVQPIAKADSDTIVVLNTLSWNRGGLVVLTKEQSKTGNGVRDDDGSPAPSQRLSTGELVFMAGEIPAFGSRLLRLRPEVMVEESWPITKAVGHILENSLTRVALDPKTGDVASLVDKRTGHEFVNTNSPYALNSFRYLRGADAPTKATGPIDVRISIKETGPVIASLLVESKAEGCRKLTREIRLIAGQPQLEILDVVDKIATRKKEGVHFAFAFNVPNATTRMDIPWGVMNPLTDQLPGANKNWLAFQRWIDVSNDKAGVTWVGLEAGIVQFGDITANLLGAVPLHAWSKKLGDMRTIVSWALNNHWHTNFPLAQDGDIPFRYAILLHGAYDPAVANRFGLEQNRPLVAVPAGRYPVEKPLVAMDNPRVFVSTLKPSEDGQATILGLRSLSDKLEQVKLSFPAGTPKSVHLCTVAEIPGEPAQSLSLLPLGLVTLRLEFNEPASQNPDRSK
jgi:hypothetical protein